MRKPQQYGPRPTKVDQARLDKSRGEYFAKNNEALRLLRDGDREGALKILESL